MKAKQLTVLVNDVPGSLARMAQALAAQKVNITAMMGVGNESLSPIRLLVDNPARAKKALRSAGLQATEEDVLVVPLANKPGSLAGIAAKLASANINILYAYATGGSGGKTNCVMAVSDIARASRLAR